MCIAIPFGNNEKDNEWALWKTVRTNPLYLLSFGALTHIILLSLFSFSLSIGLLTKESFILSPETISLYIILFGILSYVFFAVIMHFYPKLMQTGEIEYIYFGGYFFLTNYNLLFFYLASTIGTGLIISSIIIQFILFLFAFKPIKWSYSWSHQQHTLLNVVSFSLFSLLLISLALFLVFIL